MRVNMAQIRDFCLVALQTGAVELLLAESELLLRGIGPSIDAGLHAELCAIVTKLKGEIDAEN